MTVKELNELRVPIVKISKKLEKYRGKVLFPEKLAEANKVLVRVGLPKEYQQNKKGGLKGGFAKTGVKKPAA